MLKRPLLLLFLILLLAGVFCYAAAQLLVLRYQSGDVYPAYSSFRADPLGTKALYDALDELPEFQVERNFRPLKKLQPPQPVTLVYAGTHHQSYWTEREIQEFESLVLNGTRVVFTFYPFDQSSRSEREERDQQKKKEERLEKEEERFGPEKPEEKKDEPAKDEKTMHEKSGEGDSEKKNDSEDKKKPDAFTSKRDDGLIPFREVAKRFGFEFALLPPNEDKAYQRHAFLFEPGGKLERDLTWHTALYFDKLSPEWNVLYLSETKPVVVERPYGRGSILLAADSYFVSNEALRKERHSQLLSRLFSGPKQVIFDEEHHGVSEDMGIAKLAIKYRLHGVIAGLVLIAALFVWKNVARFVPSRPDEAQDGRILAGKDMAQGFVNLLSRTIQPADILSVCVEEWRRTAANETQRSQVAALGAEEAVRTPKERNPVAAYQAICRLLHSKNLKSKSPS